MSEEFNARVDAFIMANVPATFSQLHSKAESAGDDWYRAIDRRLQALRKRGVIAYRREGRSTIWHRA